ncbi:MAG: phosphate butyryltransferase [Clostridiales bacterium]|nr:phosphate butyryltransferase [Clostridiales bacterium]
MAYRNFDEIVEACKSNPEKKTVAVAGAADDHVLKALVEAEAAGIVSKPYLIGRQAYVENALKEMGADPAKSTIINVDSKEACGEEAVRLVKEGKADFIMKGIIDTKYVLKPLVKKENGLHTGRAMCVFAYNEVPQMDKLMVVADGGMIPYPTLEQKKDIILNCVESLHKLGVERPSVAVLADVEKVNPKMVETTDAAALVEMNKSGEIPGCDVVGPISFDIMMSKEIAERKGYDCPYSGSFDCAIVPTMAAGNLMHKAMIICGGTKMAGVVVGAKVPVVLTSRGASTEEKFVSMAMASLISE